MNKISLKNLNLKAVEQLSREQLKNIFAGATLRTSPEKETHTESIGCASSCGGELGLCPSNQICTRVSCPLGGSYMTCLESDTW